MTGERSEIGVVALGRMAYLETLALQRDLCRRRVSGALTRDLLLLVQHDPVITLGRGTLATSLPIPVSDLVRRGVPVHEVERGGDVTVHAPGQLVGYPILDLQQYRPDLHWYLRTLEGILIDALAAPGIALPAERRAGLTGVWVGGRKIASIGIHVKQWVTIHGFALNIMNDLSLFDLVVPCGIHGVTMTTVARELGVPPTAGLIDQVTEAVVAAMGHALDRTMVPTAPVVLGAGT